MMVRCMSNRGIGFWGLQLPGWALLIYLIYGQGIAAFDYQFAVRMGTQDPATAVTEVGVAFWRGFAFSDLVTYVPLLAAGLLGYGFRYAWGRVVFGAALGITVYWPVVVLATVFTAHGLAGWTPANEKVYWVVLPAIALWGVFGLWRLSIENRTGGV